MWGGARDLGPVVDVEVREERDQQRKHRGVLPEHVGDDLGDPDRAAAFDDCADQPRPDAKALPGVSSTCDSGRRPGPVT